MMEAKNLYLSRLLLNMRSRQVVTELAHPYEMHRTLMKAFPAMDDIGEARRKFGVLFRADADDGRHVVRVYVQSSTEPDWTALNRFDSYLLEELAGPAFECKDVANTLKRIREGQILAFRLRANPTRRVGRDGDPLKGKRVELQREEEQLAWLAAKGRGDRKGVPGGFELLGSRIDDRDGDHHVVPRVRVRCEGKVTGRKKGANGGLTMTHLSVIFEGLLRVTDAEAFVETIRGGIGSAKACGFGLLSLAPSRLPDEAGS
jgi:CRISPR system Cascade subunit CasE